MNVLEFIAVRICARGSIGNEVGHVVERLRVSLSGKNMSWEMILIGTRRKHREKIVDAALDSFGIKLFKHVLYRPYYRLFISRFFRGND